MEQQTQNASFGRKTVVIAVVLVVGAIAFGLFRNAPEPITSPFPQKGQVAVGVKPAAVKEDIRYTTFWPDGKTKMSERVELKNGVTIYRTFNHAGALREVKEFYPVSAKPGDKPALNEDGTLKFPSSQPYEFSTVGRQLKSFISFNADGKEVMTTEIYRPDGTREVVGKRLPDWSFQNLVFHKDGLTLSFSQLFARNGDLLSEQQFAEGGARLIASSQREADGFLHSKSFREDGTLLSVGIIKQYEQVIEFFHADGVTRRMVVNNTASTVTAVYFREDGEAVSKREWSSGSMTVTELVPGTGHYGPGGVVEKAYTTGNKATYKLIPADSATGKPESYVLNGLEVVDANGKTLRKFVFDGATNTVNRVWMYNDGLNTHDRMYNPDGTLKEVGWVGSDEKSKQYNAEHAKDADRQPGAAMPADDVALLKRYSKDIPYDDPRPLLTKVEAQPTYQYDGMEH